MRRTAQESTSVVARLATLALVLGLALATVQGLAGCGQKGPLTLPPPAASASGAAR
ncbi:lipoprotein [Arthrospira platensis SPKY1]|nr:lipoprotein [Arthrospira platensis SPKY1]